VTTLDLQPSILELRIPDDCSIVVVTGTDLRHDRFALRLQAEFPGLVVAWLQLAAVPAGATRKNNNSNRLGRPLPRDTLVAQARHFFLTTGRRYLAEALTPRVPSLRRIEEKLFGDEVKALRKAACLVPQPIDNLGSAATLAFIKAFNPYFILILGDTIYGRGLCACASGLTLKQHDGWMPAHGGCNAATSSLYHRDLSGLTNAVYILTGDEVDSGPVLRKAIACVADDDTLESCFARTVALGTELLCDTLRDLLQTGRARIISERDSSVDTIDHQAQERMKDQIRADLRRDFIKTDILRRMLF
jgi:folate-dependent phosphoribosylglycinamide formyltransferase PurN